MRKDCGQHYGAAQCPSHSLSLFPRLHILGEGQGWGGGSHF